MAKAKTVDTTTAEGQKEFIRKRTACPITLEQFKQHAKPLSVNIGGQLMAANIKAPFSTGSFGWNTSGKITVEIDGTPVSVQVGLNLTVVGSKELANGQA